MSDKLDKILSAYGGVSHPNPINRRQAKQAINQYISEIIGDDEPTPKDKRLWARNDHRNILRAEQRKIAGLL